MSILDTGIKNVKNVDSFNFGFDSILELDNILEQFRKNKNTTIFFIDQFFKGNNNLDNLFKIMDYDHVIYVDTSIEPTTTYIDLLHNDIKDLKLEITAVVAIGGGITLDTGKAISNLYTNKGYAADYQGWDLVKKPGLFKIGIPTISGTGSEATRTCVMTKKENGLKLGMNSDFTVFDKVILDPNLTRTVPRDQYFYTGMDAYIHCVEALNGSYRNAVGDAFSRETLKLCDEVFNSNDMMSDKNREKLMVASYLGGASIATSYVGVVHPFSAGLSVVLGTHHCEANCIVMNVMDEYYPEECQNFKKMLKQQNIKLKKNICKDLTNTQYDMLYESTIIHEKPLTNALGEEFRKILNKEKVINLFKRM
jgi:3-deoxy-alpha-D-manno-octulosonate 8-oxidase